MFPLRAPSPGIGPTMTHSGATQFVEAARSRLRARMEGSAAGWRKAAETVWGPLLTLGALILMDLVARQ